MKKLLFLFWFLSTCVCFSQQSVDLVTGTLNFKIPLFSVQHGSLAFPVGLEYSAKGVKVMDVDGWVGSNWSFSMDALISREVRGIPDDYFNTTTVTRKGWLHGDMGTRIKNYSFTSDNNAATCADEYPHWTFLSSFGYYEDTEPDVFSVNLPGLSFQFYFDENKMPQVVPYMDVIITKNINATTNKITGFTVTDGQGIKYTFDAVEYAAEYLVTTNSFFLIRYARASEFAMSYATSWKLTKIESPVYGTINLIYEDKNSGPESRAIEERERNRFPYNVKNNYGSDVEFSFDRDFNYKILKKIITTELEVEFINDLEDIKLNAIRVYDKRLGATPILGKEYILNYDRTTYEPEEFVFLGSRYFLSSLKEKMNGQERTLYKFQYYGTDQFLNSLLPAPDSPDKDEFGFYKTKATQYAETVRTGTLKKVSYELGSYDVFFYEPHQYREQGTLIEGAGLRVKKIISHDGVSPKNDIVEEYEYRSADGQPGGKLFYKPLKQIPVVKLNELFVKGIYHPLDYREIQARIPDRLDGPIEEYFTVTADVDLGSPQLLHGSHVGYEMATVKQKNKGRQVTEFNIPAALSDISANENEWVSSKVGVARTYTGTSACYEAGSILSNADKFPFGPNPNYDFARGHIKKITDFHEAGYKVREKIFDYGRVYGAASIRKIYGLALEELPTSYFNGTSYVNNKLFVYSKYEINTDVNTVLKKETETVYLTPDLQKKIETVVTYHYDSPNHREVTRIVLKNSDQVESIRRFKFVKDYAISIPIDTQTMVLNTLKNSHITQKIIESTTSKMIGGVEKQMAATITKYQFVGGKVFPHKDYVFTSNTGGSLTPSTTQTVGSNTTFVYDQNNYVLANTYQGIDTHGNMVETVGRDRSPKTTVMGYNGTLPVLKLDNAKLQEIAFSDFETRTTADFILNTPGRAAGRTGASAASLVANSSRLIKTITNQRAQFYTFSCWINSSVAGNLTIKLKNSTADLIAPISLPFGVSPWKYYSVTIPATTLPAAFTVEIGSSANTTIDDVAFYPDHCSFISNTYKFPYGVASETDSRGTSAFYSYDAWGRLNVVYDRNRHIVKKIDYKIRP